MFELYKLKHERNKLVRSYADDYKKLAASKDKNPDAYNEIAASEYFDLKGFDERINLLLSDQLLESARELDVPLPPWPPHNATNEFWETEEHSARRYLTPEGRRRLRREIDEEKARRFEVKTLWVTKFWIPLLAAGIGIIGAFTGLVAVIQHKK
jgi:hypothetical protein